MKWHALNPILQKWAEGKGYRAGWFPVSVAADAAERVAVLKSEGALEAEFYQQFMSWVENPESKPSSQERSIILMAVPRPAHMVTFDYRGKSFELTLPPTYYDYRGIFEKVREDIERLFGSRVALRKATVPYKGIASLTGFARYGRNNIAYVEGMGSYCQLLAFATPVEVKFYENRAGSQPMMLGECRDCRACEKVCPAGAIQESRFLLHAEQCLTYFSEKEGPLPEEYGRLKRSCVVCCMACQATCPVNKGRLRFENLEVYFSETETEYLLGHNGSELTPSIRSKIAALKSTECSDSSGTPTVTFRRNLREVLEWQWSHPRKKRPGSP